MEKKNYTQLISDIINDSTYAISHAQLLEKMEGICNRVTIYRILDKLQEKGTIHKVMDLNGIAKFAHCGSCEEEKHQHDHVHFSCIKCNHVSCLEDTEPKIKLPLGYSIEQVNYTISGTCPDCK